MIKNNRPQRIIKLNANISNQLKIIHNFYFARSKSKQKSKNISILKNLGNKSFFIKKKLREIEQKNSKLPLLPKGSRRVCSPTKMSDLKERMHSPVGDKVYNLTSRKKSSASSSSESQNLMSSYTTQCTREQSIIHEKVRMKVIEAKMSRFAGFKSPRILHSKFFDNRINFEVSDFDVVESTEVAHRRKDSKSLRIKNSDLSILSL